MWDLPRPGLEPVSPALAGGFSTTVPPGKPHALLFYPNRFLCCTSQPDLGRPRSTFHNWGPCLCLSQIPKSQAKGLVVSSASPPDTSAAHTEEVSHNKAGSLGHCGRGHASPGWWGMGQSDLNLLVQNRQRERERGRERGRERVCVCVCVCVCV